MSIYHDNIQKYKAEVSQLARASGRLSMLRVVAFVFLAVLIFYLANERMGSALLFVIPLGLLGFGLLVKRYYKVDFLKKHTTFLKEVNEQEILKQANELTSFPTGQAYINRDHAYVADLDIFGSHSLFQSINRSTTESGSALLAEWLSTPAPKEVILERQEAVKELTPKLEWRQDFQATGMPYKNSKSDYNKLLSWLETPVELLPHRLRYLLGSVLLGIFTTASIVLYFATFKTADDQRYLIPVVLFLLVNYFLLKKVQPVAEDIIDNTHENVKVLGGYQSLISKIESEKFNSGLLQKPQAEFSQQNYSAAGEISKLQSILDLFQLRGTKKVSKGSIGGNQFYTVLNQLWLLDIYCILAAEKRKHRNSAYLKSWAAAVSEFEVLSSIAGFSYANPEFAFPEIKEEPFIIEFEMLGHPLLKPGRRVCNNFNMSGEGEIVMITGSNMAGKSTFQRTVGINLVLSLMGAPCCAKSGQVSHMKVFTSMRTQDNLEEGVSSFYAELKRIEQLLQLIESGQPIFFMLDEMFKGTNSKDRYRGGVSLIKQLSELNAFGIISTHDLELAKLAGNHMIVANYSFNSEIHDGDMSFNYLLTEGICKDFNASELMKKSGIKILSEQF